MKESEAGPGASITWADVAHMDFCVEWAAPTAETGRVIYIPQNSLYLISERPDEITAKIRPAVFRSDPSFEVRYQEVMHDVEESNQSIRKCVTHWYSLANEIETLAGEIRGLGDHNAVAKHRDDLKKKIKDFQKTSSLSDKEVEKYQEILASIDKGERRLKEIAAEQRDLEPYVKHQSQGNAYNATSKVEVSVSVKPDPADVPAELRREFENLIEHAREPLLANVKSTLVTYRSGLDKEEEDISESIRNLHDDNKELIEKNVANAQIAELVNDLKSQEGTLFEIAKKSALSKKKSNEQLKLRDAIASHMENRDLLLQALVQDFNSADCALDQMSFTIEADFDTEDLLCISEGFNKNEKSPYIVDKTSVDLTKVLSDPGKFIEHMGSGKQKLNRGVGASAQTSLVLTATKQLRFVASLEGDRIGGFHRSSMTPGKQALFALTLILAETDEPWPLLIDQPEDDLDSRSVCDVIVQDLVRRKRERQIIMVSHDANLVIGADSEEIIVANRQGDDRPNRGGRMFEYLTGSLEHSKPKDPKIEIVLESAGIREHACEVLDGGAEAFQKRKDKYRI